MKNPTELLDPDQISNRKVEAFHIVCANVPTGKEDKIFAKYTGILFQVKCLTR